MVERSSPSTCRRSRIPPPAGTGNCAHTGPVHPGHQRVIFTLVLPTHSTWWPVHKSTTDDTDEVGRAQLPVVSTPESNVHLSKILPTTETELSRFSKSTIGGKCCKSGNSRSTNFSPASNAANSVADSSASVGTVQLSSDGPFPNHSQPFPIYFSRFYI